MAPVFQHGRGAFFSLADTAGTPFNLSTGLSDLSFDRDVGTAEVSALGDDDRQYVVGMKGATISITGHFASTFIEKMDPLVGHTTFPGFIYGPQGNGTGDRKYTGVAMLTGLSYGAGIDSAVSMNFDLQITGAVTSTTFA